MSQKKFNITHLPRLLYDTFLAWNRDDPWRLSAVVAYYAILSLPGLLVIVVNTIGLIWGPEIVQGKLTAEFTKIIGYDAALSIEEMIGNSSAVEENVLLTIFGVATLIFGATGVFYQLQISINHVWGIRLSDKAGFLKVVTDRARSFAFILVIGFLLLISFVVTAGISAIEEVVSRNFTDSFVTLVYIFNSIVSIGIITFLFALLFKYLPDAKVKWNAVWLGSIITALLFVLGKFGLGFYFGKLNPGSVYGAAGSIILLLLWVSYSSMILFFGAEFTWLWTKRYGAGVEPSSHAVQVISHEIIIQDPKNDNSGD